jgi:hypothetical protein
VIEMVLQIPERFKGLMESVQSLIHTSSQLLDQLCQGKGVDGRVKYFVSGRSLSVQ